MTAEAWPLVVQVSSFLSRLDAALRPLLVVGQRVWHFVSGQIEGVAPLSKHERALEAEKKVEGRSRP